MFLGVKSWSSSKSPNFSGTTSLSPVYTVMCPDNKYIHCIKTISAKHGSRGSLLQNLLVSYVSDEEYEHEEWRINSLMNEEPRKGEHD